MPAPTKYPDWATDGTNVVEPPAGKKAAGWVAAERPPSGWFNWWQGVVGQWTRWLDSQVVDALARIAAVEPVAADAARKSVSNTFSQPNSFQNVDAAEITAAKLTSAGDVVAGHEVLVTGSVFVGQTELYRYYPSAQRTTIVPYQAAMGTPSVFLTTVPGSLTLPNNSRAEFPLRLPAGAALGVVKLCVAANNANWTISIYKQTSDFSTGVFGGPTLVGTSGSGTVTNASSPDVASANGGGAVIAADSAYWVEVGNSGSNDMTVSGLQLNWTDPGPRNH